MKRTRTLALLTALVCLCVSLTACSPKEVLKSAILKTTTALGLRQETSDEDEVDDLVFEVDFETTDAGAAVYGRLEPGARLADLLQTQAARKDTYCELLEFCLTPRSREEVERLLEDRDILELDAPGDQPLKPSVFVDRLERAGVLVWRGKWSTGEAGRTYLVSHGLLAG